VINQATTIINQCNKAINKAQESIDSLNAQIIKYQELSETQSQNIATKDEQIQTLKGEKNEAKIIFTILGFAAGFIIGIPISF
jgi:septal ring factor EnvC (AmiA/AmiB activator)